MMSKKEIIRSHPKMDSRELARLAGCTIAYVCQTRWFDTKPGYQNRSMRKTRKKPGYVLKERFQQIKYYDAVKRKRPGATWKPREKTVKRFGVSAMRAIGVAVSMDK